MPKSSGKCLCDQYPEKADDDRSQQMRREQAGKAAFFQRNSTAGIPRRQAHECIKQAKRKEVEAGRNFAYAVVVDHNVKKQLAQTEPADQIKRESALVTNDGMHVTGS